MVDYPRHLPGFSYVGRHRYSLTFCTFERLSLFKDAAVVDCVWTQFLRAGARSGYGDYCGLFHAGSRASDCRSHGRDFRSEAVHRPCETVLGLRVLTDTPTAQALATVRIRARPRDDESSQRSVRYVLENPVRAGLVRDPSEYPFIGSSVFDVKELLEYAYDVRPAEAGLHRRSGRLKPASTAIRPAKAGLRHRPLPVESARLPAARRRQKFAAPDAR